MKAGLQEMKTVEEHQGIPKEEVAVKSVSTGGQTWRLAPSSKTTNS
jgi:hypothetical protein